MKESAVQKKIIDYLHSIGAWTVKTIQCNKAGVLDILCCYKGKFVALEVKRDIYAKMNETSELQQRTIKQIIAAGGVAGVVTCVTEVKDILDGL